MHSPHHHPLLFSRWFPYLWKAIFKPDRSDYEQEFYGNEKRGFYCQLKNGLRFKFFRYGDADKQGALYSVYIYYHDKFIMNYNTASKKHVYIVTHNPLFYTNNVDIDYLIDCIKKTIPSSTLSIFEETKNTTDTLPVLSFNVSIRSRIETAFFHSFFINHYNNKNDFSKYESIYLVRKFNEYYSAKFHFSMWYSSDGFFSRELDQSHVDNIRKICSYTTTSRYYSLYELCNPDELTKIATYKKPIVSRCKGLVIDTDDEQYFFTFHNSFISYNEYRRRRPGAYQTIKCNNNIELTFVIKLKEVMLMLQKKNPSTKFYEHLAALGIEGVDNRKSITDEQWLLYEMMDI